MGTILNGIQLTDLSDAAKDELALLISERKVVAFHEQKFVMLPSCQIARSPTFCSFQVDAGPAFQQKWMDYFGKR
jgi:sulfonate dioxygenase